MLKNDVIEVVIYLLLLVSLCPPLGKGIAIIFNQEKNGKVEKLIYRILGVQMAPQNATEYSKSLIFFHLWGLVFFVTIVLLPLGAKQPMSWDLALNTAISFITNTNWQAYSGEISLTPLMQMLAPTVQNFVSAGVGIAVLIAMSRGLRNRGGTHLGNFWQDLTRSVIYILLPLSISFAFLLNWQGVPQTLNSEFEITTLEGQKQAIPIGPVASQIAIKQLGTNGGGYYGVNSAHPLENPTPLSNFLQVFAILLLPGALVFTYGEMIRRRKQAWIIFLTMACIWIVGLAVSLWSEHSSNQFLGALPFFEGKEWRFSITDSVLWSTATSAASNGSVNAMHSSLSPLSGMVALFNIMLGEIIFGGVGSGMYGMIIFILLTVFLSGLMVGRTPEYLQKKIAPYDMKLAILALIAPSCVILLGSALSVATDLGLNSRMAYGPHGLSEILYAWASAAGNNGSAFAGLNANTKFYNLLLGLAMLIGRFGVIIPCLLIAGSFSNKKMVAVDSGSMSTDNLTFAILLVVVILILGALTFYPSLMLGPIMEQFLMAAERGF